MVLEQLERVIVAASIITSSFNRNQISLNMDFCVYVIRQFNKFGLAFFSYYF